MPQPHNKGAFKSLNKQPFGRCVVKSTFQEMQRDGKNETMCRCKCQCGTVFVTRAKSLKAGLTQSCGCLNREIAREKFLAFNSRRKAA